MKPLTGAGATNPKQRKSHLPKTCRPSQEDAEGADGAVVISGRM
jgi:hypothetical protein